jgi:hypothetical protein
MVRRSRADNQIVSDDPSILYTTVLAMMVGAFAFLRTLATERRQRLEAIRSAIEAHRVAQQEQQAAQQSNA